MGKFAGLVKKPVELAAVPAQESTTGQKRVGRPAGKRTNPEYGQFSVWLKKETQRKAKARLVLEGQELSELVQSMLEKWLEQPEN